MAGLATSSGLAVAASPQATHATNAELAARVDHALAELAAGKASLALELLFACEDASAAAAGQPSAPVHLESHRLARALAVAGPSLAVPAPPAEDLLEAALAGALRAQRPELAAGAARLVSEAYARAGRVGDARRFAERGLAATEAVAAGAPPAGGQELGGAAAAGDQASLRQERAVLLLQLANVELTAGRLGHAEARLDAAAAALRATATPDGSALANALCELRGRVWLDLGMIDLAHGAFQQVAARLGSTHPRVQMWELEEALAAEDFARAVEVATALLARSGAPLPRADLELRLAIARARLAPEDPSHAAAARQLLETALAKATRPASRVRIQLRLAGLCLDDGLVDAARRLAENARGDLETLAGATSDADLLRERAGLAVVAARCLLADSGATPAQLDATRAALVAALEAMLAEWQQQPPRPGGVGFLRLLARRDLLATLLDVERRRAPHDPAAALVHLLAAQAQGSTARQLQLRTPTPQQVQREAAPAEGGILVYLPAGVASHVFAITNAAIEHHRLPPATRTRALIRELRTALRSPPGHARNACLDDLAQRVGADVLPRRLRDVIRGWREVVIVGRELLDDLPFEALPGDRAARVAANGPADVATPDPATDDGAAWFGVEKAVSYLPSLPLACELQRRRAALRPRPNDLLLLAATKPARAPGQDTPPDLPLAGNELEPLLRPFAGTRVLAGAEATHAALLRAGLTTVTALMVLAHGVHDAATETDERPTALLLARGELPAGALGGAPRTFDGRLRCGDVEALPAVPPLVLLVACGAGAGPDRRGEDQGADLVGSFLRAGACAVVASDVEVELAASLRLFAAAHAALAQGCSVAEAFRRARSAVSRAATLADPACDAVVHVTGLGAAVLPFCRSAAAGDGAAAADSGGERRARGPSVWATLCLVLGSGLAAAFVVVSVRRSAVPPRA